MMLSKTIMFGLGDNDVVAEWYAKQLARCGKLLGECAIFLARVGFARGVIVRNNNMRRSVHNGVGEHFARVSEISERRSISESIGAQGT